MFLFDTDILSMSVRPSPPDKLIRKLAETEPDAQFTSTITLSELLLGAHRPGRSPTLLTRIELAISRLRLVDFDQAAARAYGPLAAYLREIGRPIGVEDTQIAAIALANNLTVITGNIRHFSRVPGLRVESWL